MSARRLRSTSRQSRNSIVILLSGEETSIPEAEARAVVKTYDEDAKVSLLEPRIVCAETEANPDIIARRIAFAKRVGTLIPDGVLDRETRREVEKASYRLRHFRLGEARAVDRSSVETEILNQLQGKVKLEDPEYELSLIEGRRKGRTYLLLTKPGIMNQGWAGRRPRSRAFFHPSAIFPKLSRALVNIAGVKEGETLLDPFAGTGSILLEASIVGALPAGVDISRKMARGALANAQKYRQPWLGMIRADSMSLPLTRVDAIATDVPYGRASSRMGEELGAIIDGLLKAGAPLLRRGRIAVVMHPRSSRVTPGNTFRVEGEHHLYVHRNLTRTITILRRL